MKARDDVAARRNEPFDLNVEFLERIEPLLHELAHPFRPAERATTWQVGIDDLNLRVGEAFECPEIAARNCIVGSNHDSLRIPFAVAATRAVAPARWLLRAMRIVTGRDSW